MRNPNMNDGLLTCFNTNSNTSLDDRSKFVLIILQVFYRKWRKSILKMLGYWGELGLDVDEKLWYIATEYFIRRLITIKKLSAAHP